MFIKWFLFYFFSESDGNHSTEDEASVMDDAPDKPEKAAITAAPIISVSAVPCNAGSQLILNGSSSFLTAAQPLLLNGNSLLSSAGAGVIINGLNLGDCRTVTLSPVASSSPLILNGAPVITKPGVGGQLPQQTASEAEQEVTVLASKVLSTNAVPVPDSQTIISPSLQTKTENDNEMDFIIVPKSESNETVISSSSSLSSSSPTLSSPTSLPSIVLAQTPQHQEFLPHAASLSPAGLVMSSSATMSSPHVASIASGSQLNSPSSVIFSSNSPPQPVSLPQVVPSIQGTPVSHLVQHSSGAQCPQLVPMSSLPSPAPHFQPPQTLSPSNTPAQLGAPTTTAQSTTTIVSISQLNGDSLQQQMMHPLGEQTINSTPSKVQAISISSPTQVVPAPQAKSSAAPVPLSLPQLVPVSSIQTSTNTAFPQVVPASPSLSLPTAGMPLQILASAPAAGGVAPGPLRINQLRPIQSAGAPNSMAPAVQLLNPGIIQLPSASPGTQIHSDYVFLYKINVFGYKTRK